MGKWRLKPSHFISWKKHHCIRNFGIEIREQPTGVLCFVMPRQFTLPYRDTPWPGLHRIIHQTNTHHVRCELWRLLLSAWLDQDILVVVVQSLSFPYCHINKSMMANTHSPIHTHVRRFLAHVHTHTHNRVACCCPLFRCQWTPIW